MRDGRLILLAEAEAIKTSCRAIDDTFYEMVSVLISAKKVYVTGVGKSAIAGRKLAATLATCSVPATFIDPVGLFHGEMGGIRVGDIFILVSQSGETEELNRLVDPLQMLGADLYRIVGNAESTLGKRIPGLATGVMKEPFARIPTATSAALVAVGDALAVGVASAKGYDDEQLQRFHPGGIIGKTTAPGIYRVR